uniref:Kelch-like protein 38 n=1 Tax=Diabrotica virgifera virgifera TaxID=50390 RepID=A0A6P7GQK7_DIAVI
MSCSEEVILEIEGTPVKCKRDVLISNSDYFKAMLEGNFIEKDQKTISIKDVDLKAVNIILTLLGDPRNDTEDEDVLMILHAACMLQFCEIRNMCLDKLNQILSVQNCLKVWIMAEQLELKPLVLKAKRLALTEFMSIIKENDSINDLNLQQLIRYIGSVHLVTDSELTVFQTLMKWWYDHSKDHTSDDFIKLLSCVNYKQLLPDHFREILTYPDLAITEVEDILKCLYNLLNNIPNISCSKKCLKVASVLSQSNDRKIIIDSVPCLLVRNSSNDVPNKKRLVENNEIGVDKSKLRVVYYDRKLDIFRRFVNNLKQFEVFKVKGYQEYIFLVGGICVPSNAEWNYSLLVYDSIKEIWETKSSMPFRRRHFEICVVGSKVFITGSRGHPGIIESNIFWYDYKTDEWSKEYECPKHLLEKSSKCCNYLDKFLILNLNMKCVCMFEENIGFTIFPLVFPATLDHDIKNIATECGEFSLFSYKDRLYLKGVA